MSARMQMLCEQVEETYTCSRCGGEWYEGEMIGSLCQCCYDDLYTI